METPYGSSGSSNDVVSRPTKLEPHGASGAVEYSYIGLDLTALIDMAGPSGTLDVMMDRGVGHDGTRNAGLYPGFDRFGRVVRHMWIDGNFGTGSRGGQPTRKASNSSFL